MRQQERDQRQIAVRIMTVDPSTQKITARDQNGGNFQINWNFTTPLVTVPQEGEYWIAERRGQDWFLNRRQDTVTDLSPGDARLAVAGTIYLSGESVQLNGEDIIASINNLSSELTTGLASKQQLITPVAVTGSKTDGTALTSLISALASLGIIEDQTTA